MTRSPNCGRESSCWKEGSSRSCIDPPSETVWDFKTRDYRGLGDQALILLRGYWENPALRGFLMHRHQINERKGDFSNERTGFGSTEGSPQGRGF